MKLAASLALLATALAVTGCNTLIGVDNPDQREAIGSVRLGVSSGDSLPGPVLTRLRDVIPGLDVLEGFGCSEASNIVLSTRPGDDLPGRLGTPVPGAEVSLRDEDGQPVEYGETLMVIE